MRSSTCGSVTTIVSPKALEVETKDAAIPENAEGIKIPLMTSYDVVPNARPPLFKLLGTDCKASSHNDTAIGKIITPTTIALAALKISVSGNIVPKNRSDKC